MSLYKRKDSPYWWFSFTINNQFVQRSTGTTDRAKAQAYLDKLRVDTWQQQRLGDRPTYTWEQAVLRYLEETEHKRSQQTDVERLRWLHPFLEGVVLHEITRDFLDRILATAPERSAATQNRYLATVRAVLRKAHREWDWIDRIPHFRFRPEPDRRIRWITPLEADRLVACAPAHLQPVITLALATGLRKRNLLRLRWDQIDMSRAVAWVHPDEAKAKRAIGVPLNNDALACLQGLQPPIAEFVFTYRGKPVKTFANSTWKAACNRAGITNFRFHDLRHTWASWHVQSGTSLQELMELGGWSSIKMVLRYAHLGRQHLTAAAHRISTTKSLRSSESRYGG